MFTNSEINSALNSYPKAYKSLKSLIRKGDAYCHWDIRLENTAHLKRILKETDGNFLDLHRNIETSFDKNGISYETQIKLVG